jgi:membrane-bound lytic murein transglycosylase B
MSEKRRGRGRKVAALVPIAVLSVAWTASIAGVSSPIAVADQRLGTDLPDGTSVPAQAIEAPASVTDGDSLGAGVSGQEAQQIVSTASTSGIPSAALAAYQRAETVINAADPTCHLPWQLVAAIGRVESNHGRANGNVLDDNGVATPGIYGVPLNGANQTTEILDTDAGQYDDDTQYDRAVGPMQFIPSTWSVVGVDADGDGVRNPQDIDDAALGTAVYLCSGDDDLGTDVGRQAAVYRYNHSKAYVDLVLQVMQAYMDGDFSTVPNGTVMAGSDLSREPSNFALPGTGKPTKKPPLHGGSTGGGPTATPTSGPTAGPTRGPTAGPTATPTSAGPTQGPTKAPTSATPTKKPSGGLVLPSSDVTIIPPLPSTSISPVDTLLTLTQATLQCTLDGLSQLLQPGKFQDCLNAYMGTTTP